MIITKITAEYSRSINLKEYGGPESWIKVGRLYEAQLESTDDAKMVSEFLHKEVKADVVKAIQEITDKIKQNNSNSALPMGGEVAQSQQQPRTL